VSTLGRPTGRPVRDDTPLDRGCVFWPRCTTCVFRVCVKQLGPREKGELTTALHVVTMYLAPPDRALG